MTDPLSIEKITNTEELIAVSSAVSASKGWHEKPLIPEEAFALIHSEISEALEAYREDYRTDIPSEGTNRHWWEGPPVTRFTVCRNCDWKAVVGLEHLRNCSEGMTHSWSPVPYKVTGFASELADVVIRIADFFGRRNWPTFDKKLYNLSRIDNIPTLLNRVHDLVSRASVASMWEKHELVGSGAVNPTEELRRELSSAATACFDIAGWLGCDLWDVINQKTAYNKTRLYKHGGKVI